MKEIKAIIQPFMANHVSGLMASEVRCTSAVRCTGAVRGTHNPDINTCLQLMVTDELVEPVLSAIQTDSHTGKRGDASFFVIDVQSAVRIASGARRHLKAA